MFVSEELSSNVITKFKEILGCRKIDDLLLKIDGSKILDKKNKNKANREILHGILCDKSIYKYLNEYHRIINSDPRNFISVLEERHKDINIIEFQKVYLQKRLVLDSLEYEKLVIWLDKILNKTLGDKNIFEHKVNEILLNEENFLRYLMSLKIIQQRIIEDPNFVESEFSNINIDNFCILQRKLNKYLQKLIQSNNFSIYIPFMENIEDIKLKYLNYFYYYQNGMNIILEKLDSVKIKNLSSPKELHESFMKPIQHLFGYISFFKCLKKFCYISDQRYYIYLENCFKEIAEMANDKKKKLDEKEFYFKIRKRIENSDELNDSELGEYLLHNYAVFFYRKRRGKYLILYFEKGMVFVEIETDRLIFLETILYFCVQKCKLYDKNDEYNLKVVWRDTNESKELTVIPFISREAAVSVEEIINTTKDSKNKLEIKEEDSEARNYKSIPSAGKVEFKDKKIRTKYKESDSKSTILNFFASKIQFGDLNFIICQELFSDFDDFKKKSLSRIANYLYPEKNITENSINLAHYKNFKFYFKDGNELISIENQDDFFATRVFCKDKLYIFIKHV
ncbi:hypothetical protein CWI38_1524p0030 [Hamiltosporidium tvaerminnensis]|uniref:DH domain-containing protein n=1 Tax=Hamiltosporidium tvaerminnensis TaxID=1176355 RepID=A0A4Q9LTF0_9MICR|nr:hypothetical protein CWI38_1524p0030 [Hamiltosporidium tvaerminnensis]